VLEFVLEAGLVSRFEEAGAEFPVHGDGRTDDPRRKGSQHVTLEAGFAATPA
jgi:hypothetical protein